MNRVLPKEALQEVFDQLLRDDMGKLAGVRLVQLETEPHGELCTVSVTFEKGFCSSLSLCAESSMFTRLAQFMTQMETVAQEDVEDITKEFFNVLCGQLCSKLYQATKITSRFGIPAFYHGRYQPEHLREQFTLHYSSERNEYAELIHQTPVEV